MEIKQQKLKDFLTKQKSDGMYKATIIRRLEEMFDTYPQTTFGQLISYAINNTGDKTNHVNWTDGNFLKKIESVQRQLADCCNLETGEFNNNDELIDKEFLETRIKFSPNAYKG